MSVRHTIQLMIFALYCFWLGGCNNTPTEPLPEPASLLPIPSPSAQRLSPLPTARPSENQTTFRGPTSYGDFIEVTYATDQWQKTVKDTGVTLLHHVQIEGCILDLKAGAFERREPAENGTIRLGEYEWGWGWFPDTGGIFYGISLDNRPYLLEIIYDKAFAAETIASCRTAAEAVIATFQPVAALDGP